MEKARSELLGRDLAHALRTGPFSAALHLAIEDRGIRPEEIQEKLSAAGISVSLATLSYWRRGRSRPERPESMKAVRMLEQILSLPAESLIAQLGPRRPRGRWLNQPPGTIDIDRLFEDGNSVSKIIRELDRWTYHELTRISLHDLYQVGAQRQELRLNCRQVLRANVDRVSRTVGIFRTDDLGAPTGVHALRNCRLGRVRSDPESGLQAAEIIFDRMLSQGDTVVVEYEFESGSLVATDNYYRGFSVPVGEYVLQVQFDRDAVPARCYRFERRGLHAPDQGVREVWIGSTHGAHLVAADIPPGIVGMRWEWE
ncbi:hypothetical protein [Catellatospora vulcania]|uniref:hypothetical protein n=1 Tax=Catellatospora vulcania TaxID=1460450 RepID=UPI0012D39FA6|nr:hypothetical protein [Catellatospora vulcania]